MSLGNERDDLMPFATPSPACSSRGQKTENEEPNPNKSLATHEGISFSQEFGARLVRNWCSPAVKPDGESAVGATRKKSTLRRFFS
jgi:hypothetical protein